MTDIQMPQSVADYFAASQSCDARAWSDTLAQDVLLRDPVGQPEISGRAAMFERLSGFLPMFETFSGLVPDTVHTGGDSVAVAWHGAATAGNGKDFEWSGISVFTLGADGLIAAMDAYFDASIFA